MSGALNDLRRGVVELLNARGLNAVLAMEPGQTGRWREPVIAVAVGKVGCVTGGFQDYLGLQSDGSGRQKELYGRAAEITLALDIYAPRDGGEGVCQETLAAMAEGLIAQGAAGLDVAELRAERVEFLEKEGLYRQRADCLCRAWLVAGTESDGQTLTDFEVKGRTV